MTGIELKGISKRFEETIALDHIDLSIVAGELFFLLGPSGCGKSTLLRLIAGLHEPTSGQILFNGRDVTRLGTQERNAVMCFQSYALWPHMSVEQNVRFGLDVRKIGEKEKATRVAESLEMVRMTAMSQRKPNQLSGGQQQRVALARALAVRPDCLLLDEPLSNLDAKLRLEMRAEIRRICKTSGFTTIYVTHDQKEALSVADRIAVLRDGKLAQVGTPSQLYHSPANSFVAEFIGETNLLSGRVTARDEDGISIETEAGILRAAGAPKDLPERCVVSLRPEQLRLSRGAATPNVNRWTGRTIDTTFLGEASEHVLKIGSRNLKVIVTPPLFDPPTEMAIEFGPRDAVVMRE